MPNQNGGTTEYTNIINGIQGVDSKVNEQQILLQNEFSHKILNSDVQSLGTHGRNLAQAGILLGGIAVGVGTTNFTGDFLAAQAVIQARQLALQGGVINLTKSIATTATSAAGTVAKAEIIAQGGIRGLAISGGGLFGVLGRVLGLWANVAIVLYQLWELLSSMCSFQEDIGGKVAALETELGAEKAKTARLQQHVNTLEAKVNQLPERVAQQIERPGGMLHTVNSTVDTVNSTVNTVNSTTTEIKNTMGEKFKKLFDWLPLGQLFSMLAFITSVHNAMMLSSNLVQTLAGVIDVAVEMIGLKSPEGQSINVSEILGKKASELVESIIGHSAFTALQNTLKATNRLYQAGMTIANSIQNAVDSVRNITELAAENTGKIGNALKKAGVIFENSFPTMPENINTATGKFHAVALITEQINHLDDAANTVSTVVSEMKNIQDTIGEMKTQREEWDKAKKDLSKAVDDAITHDNLYSTSAVVTQDNVVTSRIPLISP